MNHAIVLLQEDTLGSCSTVFERIKASGAEGIWGRVKLK